MDQAVLVLERFEVAAEGGFVLACEGGKGALPWVALAGVVVGVVGQGDQNQLAAAFYVGVGERPVDLWIEAHRPSVAGAPSRTCACRRAVASHGCGSTGER